MSFVDAFVTLLSALSSGAKPGAITIITSKDEVLAFDSVTHLSRRLADSSLASESSSITHALNDAITTTDMIIQFLIVANELQKASESVSFMVKQLAESVKVNEASAFVFTVTQYISVAESLSLIIKSVQEAIAGQLVTHRHVHNSDSTKTSDFAVFPKNAADTIATSDSAALSIKASQMAKLEFIISYLSRSFKDLLNAVETISYYHSLSDTVNTVDLHELIVSSTQNVRNVQWAALVAFASAKDFAASKVTTGRGVYDSVTTAEVPNLFLVSLEKVKADDKSILTRYLAERVRALDGTVHTAREVVHAIDKSAVVVVRQQDAKIKEFVSEKKMKIKVFIEERDAHFRRSEDLTATNEMSSVIVFPREIVDTNEFTRYLYRQFLFYVFYREMVDRIEKKVTEIVNANDVYALIKAIRTTKAEAKLCLEKGFEISMQRIAKIEELASELKYFSYGDVITADFFNKLLQAIIEAYFVIRCVILTAILYDVYVDDKLFVAFSLLSELLFDIEVIE